MSGAIRCMAWWTPLPTAHYKRKSRANAAASHSGANHCVEVTHFLHTANDVCLVCSGPDKCADLDREIRLTHLARAPVTSIQPSISAPPPAHHHHVQGTFFTEKNQPRVKGHRGTKAKFVVRTTSSGNFAETSSICVVNFVVQFPTQNETPPKPPPPPLLCVMFSTWFA